jgi:hypothetical protein
LVEPRSLTPSKNCDTGPHSVIKLTKGEPMKSARAESVDRVPHATPEDFSLVLGGPLYQFLIRSRLIRPPFGNLASRIAVITAIGWLPLIPLAIAGGCFHGGVRVPLLYDYEVHARLLFSVPLLVLAEVIVYFRMRSIAAQFLERHIVTEAIRPSFDALLASAMRLRNSLAAEIVMVLLALLVGPIIWREALALRTDTWYAVITPSGPSPTAAGRWYAYVSVPVFQFLLLRWYYRIFIWCRFLFQVSRLDLNLVPLHPDRCCGLGFLGNVTAAFAPLLAAHSGIVSGFIANRILHEGTTLPEYRFELVGMAIFVLVVIVGPLCVFVPKLNQAKLAGLRTYGRLASDYATGFATKWAAGAVVPSEPLLGSSDIQSMADLDNSFAIVREMKLLPFGRDAFVRLVLVLALPLAPLTLTMFSAEELLKRLIQVVI